MFSKGFFLKVIKSLDFVVKSNMYNSEPFNLTILTLTHSHTITLFDAPGKQAFSHSVFYLFR